MDVIAEAVRRGALRALDKRIEHHRERVTNLTVTEYDSNGNAFLKGSPELTCAKRALESSLEHRSMVATMDLSPPVKPA